MSRHSSSRRSRHTKSGHRRRNRAIGTGSAIGAFLAFGMTPLASAPQAHADEIELILDPIISALSGIDPTLGADVATFGADLSSVLDSIDPSLAGDNTASLASLADPAAAATTASTSTSPDIFSVHRHLHLDPVQQRSFRTGSPARSVSRSTPLSISGPGWI